MPERGFATETWDSDEWFQELSRDQRYLFIYLWTNNHCNQAGLYHITLSTISFATKIPKEELPELLNSLVPKAIWYPEDNLIWVKNFIKRQSKSSKFLADKSERSIVPTGIPRSEGNCTKPLLLSSSVSEGFSSSPSSVFPAIALIAAFRSSKLRHRCKLAMPTSVTM